MKTAAVNAIGLHRGLFDRFTRHSRSTIFLLSFRLKVVFLSYKFVYINILIKKNHLGVHRV